MKHFKMAFNVAALYASVFVTSDHFCTTLIFRDKTRGYLVGAPCKCYTEKPFTITFNVAAL